MKLLPPRGGKGLGTLMSTTLGFGALGEHTRLLLLSSFFQGSQTHEGQGVSSIHSGQGHVPMGMRLQ